MDHDGARFDVAGDHRRWLQLGARTGAHVAGHRPTDDDFTGIDVAHDGRAQPEHDDVGAENRALEASVDAESTYSLDVTAHRELCVEHRVAGAAGGGRSGRPLTPFE